MQIKNFQAETVQQALDKVRKEFGEGAVILKTDVVKAGGNRNFSVTAALDVPQDVSIDNERVTPQIKEKEVVPITRQVSNSSVSFSGIESVLLDMMLPQIAEPGLRACYLALRNSNVETEIAADICKQMQQQGDLTTAGLHKTLTEMINLNNKMPENRHNLVFIGIPGCGKSSLLAKCATELVFNQRKKVSLSTLDTFRPTAEEEIKNLAEIIGFVEDSRKVEKEKNDEYLLVDTAGVMNDDNSGLRKLKKSINKIPDSFRILVLSSAFHWKINQQALSFFKPLGIDAVAITQLDMAGDCSTLINTAAGDNPAIFAISSSRMPTGSLFDFKVEKIIEKMIESKGV